MHYVGPEERQEGSAEALVPGDVPGQKTEMQIACISCNTNPILAPPKPMGDSCVQHGASRFLSRYLKLVRYRSGCYNKGAYALLHFQVKGQGR